MPETLGAAVFGAGFVGRVHVEGIRRLGNVEVRGLAASSEEKARKLGRELCIPNASGDYRKMLEDKQIHVVHVCTPNGLHFPMVRDALAAGKHVVCEKPLAVSAAEGQKLAALAREANLANCTFHNLRFYPMVQQMRRLRESGELGEIQVVQGAYSQDWLLYDTDWSWRLDPAANGPSRAMADIGSHWCDTVEHITGLRISSLCADLQTFHKTRKRPKVSIETFAGKTLRPEDYEAVPIGTEDFGAVLVRLGERARGAFTASQVNVGRKNRLYVEIYGAKAGVSWDQERPDELWIGNRNSNNQLMLKDPSLLAPAARPYADLPGGHSEGYDDTFKQLFRRFYRHVEDRSGPAEYPQFADGVRQLQIVETVLESSRKRSWLDVPTEATAKTGAR
ncbi:MAG: Gfo/Idh/MocA family oxidoreductase [Acidobacteria bacterium]|nr:Gfo/Idh/MocA family oxidoreductase [Acidobacteriota bacterium]